jgi:DNA-binding NtrC family response regulator
MRWVLEKTFKEEGFDVTNFEEAQTALERNNPYFISRHGLTPKVNIS